MVDVRCMMENVPRSGISLWLRKWLKEDVRCKMENVKGKMVDGKGSAIAKNMRNVYLWHKRLTKNKIQKTLGFSEVLCGALCYVLFFLFLNGTTYSQSVDSLVAEAIRNNPQLKSLQYRITASEKRSESINTLPAPNLSVEFAQVPTSSLDLINGAVSNNIAVSQMFPLGGKLNAMAEVENKNTEIESNNYDEYKIKLVAQLKMSYYSLWLLDRKVEVQQKQIDFFNDIIKSLETSYFTNKTSQADILTLQSEIASAETQLLILKNQKEAGIYKLNKLLGRNLDSKEVYAEKEITADSLLPSQPKLEEILAEENPSLKKMNSMVNMNKAMIESNNKELIPDLMVQGMFMRMPQGMLLTSKNSMVMGNPKTETMYSLMFSINLPFAPWSINKYKAKEKELYAGINSIQYEKEDMEREMISNLKEALVKYKTAVELEKLYSEKVIPLNQKAIEAQTTAFQNNRTTVTSIIDSYKMLLMQQMNYYMSQADSRMALAEIEMMVGINLPAGR